MMASHTILINDSSIIYDEANNSSTQQTGVETTTIQLKKECGKDVLEFEPSVTEFFDVLGVTGWSMLLLSTVAFLCLCYLCWDTIRWVLKYTQPRHKATTCVVLTVYPVLGLCSYLGLLFQKANIFLDTCAQLYFALCMWQFLNLTLSYFGGESRFVAKMEGAMLPWKGPPCCCWPCCVCCPRKTVNKRQIRFVKILVLQHPWVQLILSIIQMTLMTEGWYTHLDMRPVNGYIYIYLLATTSFSFGLWAFIVGFKASLKQLQEFHYVGKIVCFQLCLVFLRLQTIIINSILVPSGAIPCLPPISPRVFANVIINALLLGELVILSVLARHFYKMPTPVMVTLNHNPEDTNDYDSDGNINDMLNNGLNNANIIAVNEKNTKNIPNDNKEDNAPLLHQVINSPPSTTFS